MKLESEKEYLLEKANLKRIDSSYISHEIQHLLHLDRGLFYTIRELFLRPGEAVRKFLFEDRKKFVKPVLFLVLCSVIFTIITHLLRADVSLFNIDRITPLQGKIRSKEIGAWINNSLGYSQLLMGFFIAIWLRIIFKKQRYNIFEIVVLLSYILALALLILAITIILANAFESQIIANIGVVLYFLYIIWGIGQFFGEKRIINYVKSAVTFILGVATYLVSLVFIAYLLKLIFPE